LKNKSGRYRQKKTGDGEYGHEETGLAGGLTEVLHQKGHDRRNLELVQGGCDAAQENDGQDKPG
jgi:hypothetical protein